LGEVREPLAQRGKTLGQFVSIERHGGEIDSSKGGPEPVKTTGQSPDSPARPPFPRYPAMIDSLPCDHLSKA
jgi:hypothetical protein